MMDWIPYFEAKEKIELWLKNNKISKSSSITTASTNYINCIDSLIFNNDQLNNYVSNKDYVSDTKFKKAKQLLIQQQKSFENCHSASNNLYSEMKKYYDTYLKPNSAHTELQNAEKEIQLSVMILDKWQRELYDGNNDNNEKYDVEIRNLNKIGLEKDSLYLYKTKGYGYKNSGWWLHTRYKLFYTIEPSTVYWYAKSRYDNAPYLKKETKHYNNFILSYNQIIEEYNRFIEIADGKTYTQTSSCCLSRNELDTNQNVLLKKPRLLYQYIFVDTDNTITENITQAIQDTSVNFKHQELINNALPHHLVYLLDASSSMNDFERLTLLKDDAKYLVQLQKESDRISIVSFSTHSKVILKNTPCNYKTEIKHKIDLIEAMGSTNVDAGMQKAFYIADSCKLINGKTKILLITDGQFEMNKASQQLLKMMKKKDIKFCIIYLGNQNSALVEKKFKAICKPADGNFYNTNTINLVEVLIKEATE